MFQRFEVARVLALVLTFVFAGPSSAVNPDHLDIRLNRSLHDGPVKQVSYGTTIQIDGLKDWTHGNVVDLAFAAHAKFVRQFDLDTTDGNPDKIANLHPRKDRPTVTTTLVIDNTAYIATSLRGRGSSYIYDITKDKARNQMAGVHIKDSHPLDNAVFDGLRRCQAFAVNTDRGHRNSANCGEFIIPNVYFGVRMPRATASRSEGEFMATLAFCIDTGRRDLENARMVAIRTDKDSGKDEIVAPCDNDLEEGKPPLLEQWGCTAFAFETNIRVLTDADGRESVVRREY